MALATNSTPGEIILSGDLNGSADPYAPELTATGVVPGSYNLGNYVVDVKGRIVFAEDFSVVDVPFASDSAAGIGKVCHHLSVDEEGCVSVDIASETQFGRIQAGDNVLIDGNDVLCSDYPIATTSSVGVISIDGSDPYLNIDGAGELTNSYTYVPTAATTTVLGDVIVPTSGGLDIDGSGNISVPDATSGAKGVIQGGDHVTLTAGVLDIDKAVSDTTFGVVRSADTNNLVITAGEIDVGSNVSQLETNHIFTKTQSGLLNTLTPSPSVTPDGSLYQFFKLTLNQTTTLNTPSSPIIGTTYHIIIDLNGNELTLDSSYQTSSNVVPLGITVISCYYNGSNFQTIIQPDFI